MFGDKKFTFTEAMKSGIYFDRCIDLQAFDSDMNNLLSQLFWGDVRVVVMLSLP